MRSRDSKMGVLQRAFGEWWSSLFGPTDPPVRAHADLFGAMPRATRVLFVSLVWIFALTGTSATLKEPSNAAQFKSYFFELLFRPEGLSCLGVVLLFSFLCAPTMWALRVSIPARTIAMAAWLMIVPWIPLLLFCGQLSMPSQWIAQIAFYAIILVALANVARALRLIDPGTHPARIWVSVFLPPVLIFLIVAWRGIGG